MVNEIFESMFKRLVITIFVLAGLCALLDLLGCGQYENLTDKGDSNENQSCTVTQVEDGAQISCPDGSTAEIKNGAVGSQGATGASGPMGNQGSAGIPGVNGRNSTVYTVVPCPSIVKPHAQLLLCINETLYAIYQSHWTSARFDELTPGAYITNDGRNCHFTLIKNCEIR